MVNVYRITCNICNKEFLFKHNLKRHNETLHSVQLENWHCSYCGKGFNTKYGMIAHVKLQHFSLLPYVCQDCNAGFMKFKLLFEHLSTVHSQNIVNVKNPARHTVYNKQDNEKFYCSYCSKEFLHKVRLIEHMHSDHADDFPCKCETCNQGFLKKSFLVIHALKAHATILDLNDADDQRKGTGDIMQVISTRSVMPSKSGEQEPSTDVRPNFWLIFAHSLITGLFIYDILPDILTLIVLIKFMYISYFDSDSVKRAFYKNVDFLGV